MFLSKAVKVMVLAFGTGFVTCSLAWRTVNNQQETLQTQPETLTALNVKKFFFQSGQCH
jgi:hypothetical protein